MRDLKTLKEAVVLYLTDTQPTRNDCLRNFPDVDGQIFHKLCDYIMGTSVSWPSCGTAARSITTDELAVLVAKIRLGVEL